jgi:hypothetical protein
MARFTFDVSPTRDSSPSSVFHLTAVGNVIHAPPGECYDLSCVKIENGAHLTFKSYNFGRFKTLSFSMWYKPLASAGTNCRLLDLGDGDGINNIGFGRHATSQMIFYVFSPQRTLVSWTSAENVWVASTWRHVVWTIAATNATHSNWRIYIDGGLRGALTAISPTDAELRRNYVGKSNTATAQPYAGHIDSFYIYNLVLDASGAMLHFKVGVRLRLHLCVFVCMYECTHM